MNANATETSNAIIRNRKPRRLAPTLFVCVSIMVCAVSAIARSDIWVLAYAKYLMPDVEQTDHGLRTPPLVAVDHGFITTFGTPVQPVVAQSAQVLAKRGS
ncbi:MAG: hypothetical protein H6817_08000 [Phycisphaerales bacterium]|nr:hypothetical protein [Phycisphaerales bacterium]